MKYLAPEMEVLAVETEDIILASADAPVVDDSGNVGTPDEEL